MDINFCNNCDNIMFVYSDESQTQLYLGCKVCGEKTEYTGEKSIYKNNFKLDNSETINNNKYLTYDNTLPVLKSNKNIKCPNETCTSITENLSSNITYVKFNEKDMKYLYICRYCGQKWKNN